MPNQFQTGRRITSTSYFENDKSTRNKASLADLRMASVRDFDTMPTVMSSDFLEGGAIVRDSILGSYAEYGSAVNEDPNFRTTLDTAMSIVLNKPYEEISRNHDFYKRIFSGKDLDDKTLATAMVDAWNADSVSNDIAMLQRRKDATDDPEEEARIEEQIKKKERDAIRLGDYTERAGISGWFGDQLVKTMQIAPQVIAGAEKSMFYALTFAALSSFLTPAGAGATLAGSGLTGTVSMLGYLRNLASTAQGASQIGAAAGTASYLAQDVLPREYGNMSRQLENFVDKKGNKMDKATRKKAASVYAVASTLIEFATPEPGFGKLLYGIAPKQMLSTSFWGWLKRVGVNMLEGGASESLEEALQDFVGSLTQNIAASKSDKKGATNYDLGGILENLPQYISQSARTFLDTFIPSALVGLPGAITSSSVATYLTNVANEHDSIFREVTQDDVSMAKAAQRTNKNTIIIPNEIIDFRSGSTTEFANSIEERNQNSNTSADTKFDPVKVRLDRKRGRYVPIDDYNANLAKYLYVNLKNDAIAVDIVNDGSIRISPDDIRNAVEISGGAVRNGVDIVFRTQEDAYKFANSLGDSVVIYRDEGNQLSIEYTDTKGTQQISGIEINENANIEGIVSAEAKRRGANSIQPSSQTTTASTQNQQTQKPASQESEEELASAIRTASRGHISKNAADALAKLFNIMPEEVRNTIFSKNDGKLVISDSEYERITGRKVGEKNRALSWLNRLQMVLTGKSDASSFVHEMGHITLLANPELGDDIRLAFNVTLESEGGLDTMLRFIEENKDIIGKKSTEDATRLLREIGNIDKTGAFSENAEELVMSMLEAHFRTDLKKRNMTTLPQNIQAVFRKVADAIRRVYGAATGKTELPKDIQDTFNSFFWNGDSVQASTEASLDSNATRSQAMLEGYEQRRIEYKNRIKEWLSDENKEHFKDMSLKEIMEEVGRDRLPIAEVPVEIQEYFGVDDARVYSGKAFFIDHAIHNHPELSNDEYFSLLSVLENPDYTVRQTRDGAQNVIMVKQVDGKWYEGIVGRDKETGKMIIYLTYFGGSTKQNKVAKYDPAKEIKIEKPPVFAMHASGSTQEGLTAVGLSSLGASPDQTITPDSEPVNVKAQAQIRYMNMDNDRFIRCVDKDIFLPEYVVKNKLGSEDADVVAIAQRELNDRDKFSLLSDEDTKAIYDTETVGEYVSRMKTSGSLTLSTDEETERVYRKAWEYAHVMTPKEAVASFKDQFNTLPKLLGLKQALGPRAIRATGEDGRSYMQMHVPANNVVYQKLVNLTPDSTIEEVNEVLSSISSNPKEWIRAYQDAVSSGARVAGTLSEDADVVNNYIDLADSDFSVISKDLRRGEEPYGAVYDTVYGIPSSEVENLSVEEADRASVEAGNVGEEFSESTVGEEASALRSSISVAKKAEADANALASDLEAEIKEVESRNQPEADNKLLSELRAKLEDAKAEAHAQQVRANKLERRLTALATRTTSERITRGIRRKLNFNSKSYDTGMVEQPLYYVYYLMHNGQNRRFSETTSTESMPDLDWDLERIRTGMADNLSAMDENGNIENITVDFENYSGNLGAYRYNRADIPSELKSRLKQGTIDALQKPGRLTWNMLTNGEKRDIYNAVTSLKKAAKDAREEATDPRFMERRALAREAAKAVLGADIGEITDEMREITKRRMQGINPDYDGTPTDADVWDFISKHPKQYINSVEVSKGKKIRDSLSLSFLKIQRIAKILDGGKDDGPFQRIFVRSFMNAYDNVMKNIDRRSTSFQTALEGIIGAKGSKEYREKMDSLRNQKLHMHTRAAVGPGKDVTLMEAMGMYIYSQNINGFSKLVSSDGNNFSLEDMARINPDAVLRYINLDLAERADIKRDADHPSEFPYETPEYLQSLKSRIEAGEFVSEVPEWVRNIGDMMINELAKESPRIAEVGLKEYNTLLQIQDRYFPLVQASRGSWGDLFGSPFKGKGAKVNNGSIQARRKDARYPLMLDPFSVFLSAIREQENLINMTKPVADASYLLKFGLSDVVSNRFGDKWAKALDDYVKRIATPENTLTDVEKLANVFLGNAAAAKIGFNIMTSIKQFVSLIPAAVDGELSPADIVHGISQAFNPEARELMDRYAYSVLRSGYDPDITRLRGITDSSRLAELDRKAIEKFTWLTQKGDELSKAIIWTAKYDKGMRAGLSVEDAAYEATDLVNRTMSVTNPISLAALQTNKSPFAREFFLFTNDLFQMWNIMFADIPMDFKNADWGKMFSRFSGVVASAATLALLAGGWLPDKDDDKDTVFSGQDFLGDFIENIVGYSIPLVGQNAADYLRGYNSQSLITIPTEIFSTARMIYRGATGIKEYSPEEYLDQILYTAMSAAEVVGVPATGLKRTGQSVYDYDQGQWRINLWYLLGSRWGRGTPNLLHNLFD